MAKGRTIQRLVFLALWTFLVYSIAYLQFSSFPSHNESSEPSLQGEEAKSLHLAERDVKEGFNSLEDESLEEESEANKERIKEMKDIVPQKNPQPQSSSSSSSTTGTSSTKKAGQQNQSIKNKNEDADGDDENSEAKKKKIQEHVDRLGQEFEAHLMAVQFPSDCSKARFYSCDVHPACGFGCQIHHLIACFNHALMSNRTLIHETLDSYGPECNNRWDCFFKPISSCTSANKNPGNTVSMKELSVGAHEHCVPKKYEVLSEYMEDPRPWLVGQYMKFLLRPNERVMQTIDQRLKKLNLKLPVDYGVHIRRSDKIGTEAKFHGWREYFQHIDMIMFPGRNYHSYHNFEAKTSVYISTDDQDLFSDKMLQTYKHNKLYWNKESAVTAGDAGKSRYSQNGLDMLIFDIYVMATAKGFVGTFSSQVSRIVYELWFGQGRYDAEKFVYSLDEKWYGVM